MRLAKSRDILISSKHIKFVKIFLGFGLKPENELDTSLDRIISLGYNAIDQDGRIYGCHWL